MNADQAAPSGRLDRFLGWSVAAVALGMVGYHMLMVWHPLFGELINQNNHLGFCLVLLFLHWARSANRKWPRVFYLLGVPVSLALVTFMAVENERLTMEAGWPEPLDVVVGVFLIVFVVGGTWKNFGAIFPVMVLIAIGYALWGHLIPGVMGHPEFEFGYIVSNLSSGFQGIYGMLLNVSVNILFLLVIFGSIFEATGVTSFFMELGGWFGRHLPGGAGHTAVFSSSFVGMVNGAAVANVAITGSVTIPVMKKAGFRGEIAGAIEAMASTGGQLTPPIMGIAVFIMASFLGVSYGNLMFKALIPAVFYYAIAVCGVILIAYREGIPMGLGRTNLRSLLTGSPVFVLPMGVLTTVLLLHYSPGYAAFLGILTLLAVSCLRSATRPGLDLLIRNLIAGAVMAATFGLACGCIGILIKSLTFTGASTKLSLLINALSGGLLLPTLGMTMILSIILSSSTPTVIAYIVVAFVAAPILVELGLRDVVAHFFVYYYAILAAVTPPIAGAAMVGGQIAGAKYMKTAWESFKLVGPFYLLPFFTVNNPIVFGESQPLFPAVMALGALAMALGALMCFCQRYCFTPTTNGEQTLLILIALLAAWHGLSGRTIFFVMPLVLTVIFLFIQWQRKNTASASVTLAQQTLSEGYRQDITK